MRSLLIKWGEKRNYSVEVVTVSIRWYTPSFTTLAIKFEWGILSQRSNNFIEKSRRNDT